MITHPETAALDIAPDFEMIDTQGRPFRLYEQLERGAVVLVFNRGFT